MKFIGLLFLSVLGFFIIGCSKTGSQKPEEEKSKEEKKEIIKLSALAVRESKIEFMTVGEGELSGIIQAPAKIIPNQDNEAFVGSLIQGRVSKVNVNLGDNVRKGQILMFIEGLQIGEIKSQFLKAKASLSYSEANYFRLKSLIEQNVGSQKSYLEAKADYEKAKAEFNAEDKKIHSIGLSDKDIEENDTKEDHSAGLLAIKAPIDGVIVERNVAIGQLVEPNTNSFRIMNISSLFADGQVYDYELQRIAGKPDITIRTSLYPDILFKGKLINISDVLDKDTKTFRIRASIQNQDKKLKPEMFVDMMIPTAGAAKGIVIPTEALVRDGDELYIFQVVNDSTFKKMNVSAGATRGDFVEIRKGIAVGDRIVSKGTFLLKSEIKKSIFGEGD